MANGAHFAHLIGQREQRGRAGEKLTTEIDPQAIPLCFCLPFWWKILKTLRRSEKGDIGFPIYPADRLLKGKFWFLAEDSFG